MNMTFFDRRGILFDEAVPMGQSVTGNYYLTVLRKMRLAISDKRPEMKAAGPISIQEGQRGTTPQM